MIHRVLRGKPFEAYGAFEPMSSIVVLNIHVSTQSEQKGYKKSDLFPPSLRGKHAITLGAFEAMFRIVVLGRSQQVAIVYAKG